jgi:hypothetical protein
MTTENQLAKMVETKNEQVVILFCSKWSDSPIILPQTQFQELFDLNKNVATFKESNEWHPYSGGEDTFIQSYTLNHARSYLRFGSCQLDVQGMYKLSWL